MGINISVQYNGGFLPDIILLTQCYYHRGTRLNTMHGMCTYNLYNSILLLHCLMVYYIVSGLFLLFFWCPCMGMFQRLGGAGIGRFRPRGGHQNNLFRDRA